MCKGLLLLLLILNSQFAFSQAEHLPFRVLMHTAKVKKLITVDTVGGKTNVLLTTHTESPEIVFAFASGGEGGLALGISTDGTPVSKRGRSFAHTIALGFLEKQVAVAAIDVPEIYGSNIAIMQRQDERHIVAIAQVAKKLRDEYPKARHILIGHSNGGITAGMQAIQTKPAFDGIVLSAPNLAELPSRWDPKQAKAPIMFIVHENDYCGVQFKRPPINTLTIRAAGNSYPLTVIKSPSPGLRHECFTSPAPHFFTDTEGEYTDAIIKWAMSLK